MKIRTSRTDTTAHDSAVVSDEIQDNAALKRRPLRVALLVVIVAILCWSGTAVVSAFHQTELRELYLPQLEARARQEPTNGPLQALLGARLMEAADYNGASDALHQAVSDGEQDPVVWQSMAASVAASGDPVRAVADLQIAIHATPPALSLKPVSADAIALGKDVAPQQLAVTISPLGAQPLVDKYAAGSFLNGVVEWWGKHHPDSSGFATRRDWAIAEPNNADARRLWAEALMKNRRFPEALDTFRQAVDLNPKSAENHLALAEALASTGSHQASMLEYIECLKLRKDWLPALLGFGKTASLGDLRNYTYAAFKRASQIDPRSVDAWVGLGGVALQTGVEYKDAIANFEKAAQLAPGRTDFYTDYADALRRDSQWERAETVLRQRLAADSNDAIAHYMLGMVLMDLRPTPDRMKEAETESQVALRLSPNNPLVNLQLGQLYLGSGRTDQAIDAIQQAIAVHPLDYKANVVLANAYRREGKTALADQVARKAAAIYHDLERIKVLEPEERKNPQDMKVRDELARLYESTGNVVRATQEASILRTLKANPASSASRAKSFADDLHNILPTY